MNTQGCVEILCGISRQQVIEKYQEADVYVSGSGVEVMSISLCESAAAGKAILSTDTGHTSLIPGVFIHEGKTGCMKAMQSIALQTEERIRQGKESYEYAPRHYKINKK